MNLDCLAFQSFDYERTWRRLFQSFDYERTWSLFQKRVVSTKFDIYVFIIILWIKFKISNHCYLQHCCSCSSSCAAHPVIYVRLGIVLTCGKHLHDSISVLGEEVWGYKTSSIPPLFIEVSMQSQQIEWAYICVLLVSILALLLRFSD